MTVNRKSSPDRHLGSSLNNSIETEHSRVLTLNGRLTVSATSCPRLTPHNKLLIGWSDMVSVCAHEKTGPLTDFKMTFTSWTVCSHLSCFNLRQHNIVCPLRRLSYQWSLSLQFISGTTEVKSTRAKAILVVFVGRCISCTTGKLYCLKTAETDYSQKLQSTIFTLCGDDC